MCEIREAWADVKNALEVARRRPHDAEARRTVEACAARLDDLLDEA